MNFLRFYDGAVPGKNRKTEETNGARKKKIKSLNMPKKNKLKSTFWKNKVLFNLIKQRKVQLYEMVLVTSFKLHHRGQTSFFMYLYTYIPTRVQTW